MEKVQHRSSEILIGEKTHSACGSKSNFRDFNRMTLKNCAITKWWIEPTLPPHCPENQFSSSKQKPGKSLSPRLWLCLRGAEDYSTTFCNFYIFDNLSACSKHFHKVEKIKRSFIYVGFPLWLYGQWRILIRCLLLYVRRDAIWVCDVGYVYRLKTQQWASELLQRYSAVEQVCKNWTCGQHTKKSRVKKQCT